jgi:hypothetical protein
MVELVGASVMKERPQKFNRNQMLKIYCCCRQAERSLDNSFSTGSTWSRFVAYYDEAKRNDVRQIIDRIGCKSLQGEPIPNRTAFFRNNFLTFLGLVRGFALNRVIMHYKFSGKEAMFLCSSFGSLLTHLESANQPAPEALIELRMDFYTCGEIIDHKLVGIQQVRKARNVEHFDQSPFIAQSSLSDLLDK